MPAHDLPALQGMALFQNLTQQELAWVNGQLYRRFYPAGTAIITAELPGEVVYIIQTGSVKIHIEQEDGRDVVLAILGPGDTVGEMSMLDSAGRSASAVTLEDSLLLWMSKHSFQECLRTIPAVTQNLVRILSGRVRLANELIQALAALDVHGRVARQLLAFADQYGQPAGDGPIQIPFRLTQSDLADLVGASRKRVNQVMVTFKQQELIRVDAEGHVLICNRAALAKLCR